MDGKENKVSNGAGTAAENQIQEGQPGSQAAGAAGTTPIAPDAAAGESAKTAHGYAVEIASRDAQIAERDGRIAELEGQLEKAAKVGEQNESLKTEIEQLKMQAASERIDFALQLAGCRSVKAARAVLEDYDGDIEKLKAAEPWMFEAQSAQTGATGLSNAGTASDDGKDERRWRKLVGLPAKKSE